jgi:hypothetical protein
MPYGYPQTQLFIQQTGQAENLEKRVGKLVNFKFLFMKKARKFLPLLALVFAITTAWTVHSKQVLSDKVWFETDEDGDALNPNDGRRGDSSPFGCSSGPDVCARALSIEQGEVSLNSGSSSIYHINTGFNTQDDYDFEEYKP